MPKRKYLLAAALVALCAALTASGAFAADGCALVGQDFPSDMLWDDTADVSVDADNTGDASPADTWDTDYDLRSVEGITSTATAVDRWGLTLTPVGGITPAVAVGESYSFDFTMTAPPITTLVYNTPVAPTTPAVASDLECDWMMANLGSYITTDIVENDIAITRFTDIGPTHWALFHAEECAGRVPVIVRGYPDSSYQPTQRVTRDQMAVYIRRSMKIPQLTPAEGTFADVPDSDPGPAHWAYGDIEALVDDGVVQGYGDDLYHPELYVSRRQMAVYVQRAKDYATPTNEEMEDRYQALVDWIDDGEVGAQPEPIGFLDMPVLEVWVEEDEEYVWSVAGNAGEVYACVDNDVVQGYPDYTYRPTVVVTRDQMAVYVYRAFIQPTGCAVVLAGPDVTDVDPSGVSYVGYSHQDTDPGYAYVGFDAVRLDTNLATASGPTADWDITFEFYGMAGFWTEDLSSDPGWSTTGQWAYGVPQGNTGPSGGAPDSYDPTSGHTGSNVYGYNLSGAYASNLSEQYLTTPAIDCSAYEDIHLAYWRWLGVEEPSYDRAAIEVSGDNGSTWTEVYRNSGTINDGAWAKYTIDISALADGQSQVKIRWVMGWTDGSWQYCGWNIDDIALNSPGLVDSKTVSITSGAITAAKAAAAASGDPYYMVSTALPALPSGTYTLVVKVEDGAGGMQELVRTVTLTVS